MVWTSASIRAQHEIIGTDEATQEQLDASADKIVKRVKELMDEKMRADASAKGAKIAVLSNLTRQFESFLDHSGPAYQDTLETLLKSILIQMWGNIEVMLGDLWELVLNEHPYHLSGLLGNDSEKQISLSLLEKHKFDLSKTMGTLLKGKFTFTVLVDIKKAYSAAFRDDGESIQQHLASDSLRGLSAVRNVLVHRGGILDENFMKGSSKIAELDEIRSYGVGGSLFLDGITLKNLIDPALKSSVDVIKSVDEWLIAHPLK